MKPAVFEYERPADVDTALRLLSEHGDTAKVLAGGQSLVPLLNFRLLRIERLLDINNIGSLSYIVRRNGILSLGALTRQRHLELSPLVREGWPLLSEAAANVGHFQIRNRGSVGGSVAHADPSAELPTALAALDARMVIRSTRGLRTVGWRDFFVSALTTSLSPDELLVEIQVPAPPRGCGSAFCEFAARRGDFALAAAAAVLRLDADGVCQAASLAVLGVGSAPHRARSAEEHLVGSDPGAEAARAAAAAADELGSRSAGDASLEYRRKLIEHLARLAIGKAARRAAAQMAP